MLYPSIHWSYKSQPFSNSFPTQGFNINANVAGTIKALSQQSDFIQASFSARFLKTFFNQNTRLLARTSVATTYIDKMDNLPLSMQLFAGGPGSIRGYHFHELPENNTLGRNLLTASIELQQRLYGQIYLAGFIDAGNVTNSQTLFTDLKSAAGLGFAVVSLIGTFELTAAKPSIQIETGSFNSQWSHYYEKSYSS